VNASLPSSPLRRGTDPWLFLRLIYGARVLSVRCSTLLLLVFAVVESSACTLLVDTKVRQCQTTADCTRFGDSVCDEDQLICVPRPPSAPTDAAAPGIDAAGTDAGAPADGAQAACQGTNGCYSCAPANDVQYLNACTEQRCFPFDNRARLQNLASDGTLKPLP
jgi:hypothetical protein